MQVTKNEPVKSKSREQILEGKEMEGALSVVQSFAFP